MTSVRAADSLLLASALALQASTGAAATGSAWFTSHDNGTYSMAAHNLRWSVPTTSPDFDIWSPSAKTSVSELFFVDYSDDGAT